MNIKTTKNLLTRLILSFPLQFPSFTLLLTFLLTFLSSLILTAPYTPSSRTRLQKKGSGVALEC